MDGNEKQVDLNRIKPALAAGSVCLFFFTFQFYRYVSVVIAIWIIASGIAVGCSLFSYFPSIPCLFLNNSKRKKVTYEDDDKLLLPKGCTICGSAKCQRHRPEVALVKIQPWVGLDCPESVDIAIDDFLTLVLQRFVYGWYSDLSTDDTFVDELRSSLRYIASVLVRRVRKVDIPTFVTEKLLKEGLKHFDWYMKAKEKVKDSEGSENLSSVVNLLEADMHSALHSRSMELLYLRKVADGVLPHLLPPQSLKCRSLIALLRELLSGAVLLTLMDKLSDPDFVNSLWLVFLDKQPMVPSNQEPSSRTPFLENFAKPRAPLRNSALHLSLGEILHSQTALFPFMQFMRKEAALNVLQFCLTIEDFNKRFFAPDVSPEEELSLIKEAEEMYNSYFDVNAVDRINFDKHVIEGIRDSIKGPVNKMGRLKMAALLSKAYEHAYNLLEGTFLPLFYQSDDYFSLLCGSRLPARPLNKQASRASKKKFDPLAEFSKLAGKIKHKVLNPVREDYSPYDELDPYDIIETPPDFAMDSDDEVEAPDEESRDLSTWKISIPHVIMENKYKCIYIISVKRQDAKDGEEKFWDVARRYKEFYVLQSKLEEFHGAIDNSSLPVKQSSSKMGSIKKPAAYYESCRDQFESYIQELSKNPLTKGSALLFYFLSPNKEFLNMFESKSRKGNIAGKTLKTVTTIFTKERGQNIDPFLHAYLISIEETARVPSLARSQSVDAGVQTSDLNHTKDLDQWCPRRKKSSADKFYVKTDSRNSDVILSGVTDYILFIADRLVKLPRWMLHILSSLKIIGGQSMNYFADRYLNSKIELLKDEYRITMIVHLLRDAIFFDKDPPRTDADKLERREQTLKEMVEFLPDLLVHIIGKTRNRDAMNLLLEVFQHPKLNKQLAYTLLDVVLSEVFPELNNDDDTDTNIEEVFYHM